VSQRRLAPFVQPGAKCLEVGPGGGSIARWLAARVGERGHVTALDLKPDHIPRGPTITVQATTSTATNGCQPDRTT
jgi:ubiquinone/menaquinone biosynthesis C-methylase UbiE